MSIFHFSKINKSEEIIQRTWNDFRSALAIGSFSYDDIVCAKSRTTFLKVFDELFSNCHQELDITMQAALSPTTTLMRAGKLNPNDPEPTYSRFIPNKEYITDHNRFSPPGVEWLYLAVGDFDTAKKCALKECRASLGDTFGLCEFRLSENYAVRTLVDLTIANTISYEEINERLRRAESEIKNREKDKILMSISKKGYVKFPDVSDIKYEFSKWMAYTYVKLLSEQIA